MAEIKLFFDIEFQRTVGGEDRPRNSRGVTNFDSWGKGWELQRVGRRPRKPWQRTLCAPPRVGDFAANSRRNSDAYCYQPGVAPTLAKARLVDPSFQLSSLRDYLANRQQMTSA